MAQIKLEYPIKDLKATLTLKLEFSKAQAAIGELYGRGKQEQENLLNQVMNEITTDVAAALGIPYDSEPS